ncbi:MAG: hypothetical protein OXH39_13135 [Candidatus Poribacteria bacterium]|nr:hypothetical protein [Candidatus Poribacteria bacterium]
MKRIVILFISLLSLSLFYSCGDIEDADIPNPIAETEIEANILAKPPDETWIVLTDEYVAELMELEIPPDFIEIKDLDLREKYHHAIILKQFGDIPQVRTVIEYEMNQPNLDTVRRVRLTPLDEASIAYLERKITYLEAMVFLWPFENTKAALEDTKKSKLRLSLDMDKLRTEDPELYVQIEREMLIETLGDIPEVHTYTKLMLKILKQEPLTEKERNAYLKAMNHLWSELQKQ